MNFALRLPEKRRKSRHTLSKKGQTFPPEKSPAKTAPFATMFSAMTDRLSQLLSLLQASPDDAFLLFAVAKEYEGTGELDQALAHYLHLRAADPQYTGLYYHLGKLYEMKSEPDAALEAYAAGIEVARNSRDLHALSELQGAKLNLEIGE